MNVIFNATQFKDLPDATRQAVEDKLAPVARLLGEDEKLAILDLELAEAPAEGRSSTPAKLSATLTMGKHVFHAEAVKPTPESAADRVRSSLEHEIRKVLGKEKGMFKRGALRVKNMLRFGS
ncbi:MAG TPA: HPF/RaiA family ribosome-associated protein [Candidatus Paceibacterota bacterium]|nr:HPF/RaiA family ribosome-associated protein [Candidatus Paceibacterota bacterium]